MDVFLQNVMLYCLSFCLLGTHNKMFSAWKLHPKSCNISDVQHDCLIFLMSSVEMNYIL